MYVPVCVCVVDWRQTQGSSLPPTTGQVTTKTAATTLDRCETVCCYALTGRFMTHSQCSPGAHVSMAMQSTSGASLTTCPLSLSSNTRLVTDKIQKLPALFLLEVVVYTSSGRLFLSHVIQNEGMMWEHLLSVSVHIPLFSPPLKIF